MAFSPELGEWYDASQLTLYQTCPRRFYYRYVLNLTSNTGPGPDILFGSAIHKALEDFYLGVGNEVVECPHRFPGDSDCPFHKEDGTTWRMFSSFLKEFPPDSEKPNKTQEIGLRLLSAYVKKFKHEPFQVESVEQPFTMEFTIAENDSIKLVGKVDLTIMWDGDRMPFDHKTTSQFGTIFNGQYRFDIQMTLYSKAHASGNPKSAIVNGLRPSNNISASDSFLRYITTRSDWDFEEFDKDIRGTIKDIRRSEEEGYYRKHPHSCYSYMRECEFKPLCNIPEHARPNLIETLYIVEKWEPF